SNAMLKQLVPTTQLPRAVAVNQGRQAAVEMASGPVGGALLGLSIAFPPLAQLLGNLGSVLATLTMRRRYFPRTAGAERTRVGEDLREALRWMISQPLRLQILAVASSVNLGANGIIFAVLLDLAADGVPATRIGLLNTVLAAAILLGALLAPRLVDTVPTGVLAIAPVLLMALVGVFLALDPGMLWIGAAYAVLGVGIPAINASSQGFFTHITPVALMAGPGQLADAAGLHGADAARARRGRLGARPRGPAAHHARLRRGAGAGRGGGPAGPGPAPDPHRPALGGPRPKGGAGGRGGRGTGLRALSGGVLRARRSHRGRLLELRRRPDPFRRPGAARDRPHPPGAQVDEQHRHHEGRGAAAEQPGRPVRAACH